LVVTEFTYLQFYIAMGCFYRERCYGESFSFYLFIVFYQY